MWDFLEEVFDFWKSLNFFLRYFILGALIVGVCIFFWTIVKIVASIIFMIIIGIMICGPIYWIIKLIMKFR